MNITCMNVQRTEIRKKNGEAGIGSKENIANMVCNLQ